jgi:hypothetical protein
MAQLHAMPIHRALDRQRCELHEREGVHGVASMLSERATNRTTSQLQQRRR